MPAHIPIELSANLFRHMIDPVFAFYHVSQVRCKGGVTHLLTCVVYVVGLIHILVEFVFKDVAGGNVYRKV